jgi:hypothetical protein
MESHVAEGQGVRAWVGDDVEPPPYSPVQLFIYFLTKNLFFKDLESAGRLAHDNRAAECRGDADQGR